MEIAPPGRLRIDAIELPGGGLIGLTHCPGRSGRDALGRHWQRSIGDDLDAIEAWGAGIVITLVESGELMRLGVADLAERMRERRFEWHHVPIPDMHPPGPAALAVWRSVEPAVLEMLGGGGRVVMHCAAGLGRTGTMAARLLVDRFGHTPQSAIALVRARRPGAIETREQEAFIAGRR